MAFTECKNSDNHKLNSTQADTIKQASHIMNTTPQVPTAVFGQSSKHTELSNIFNFKSESKRFQLAYGDSCIITINVESKKTKKIAYAVHFTADFLLGDSSFMNTNVRSYITGKNKNAEVADNDFGDIVVADFNFDNREDFAIKREEGGNGGPLYNYYIQTADTSFKLNEFLSDTMIWFPTYFNKNKKTLTTLVHASAASKAKTIYKCNVLTGKWKEVSQNFIDNN